MPEMPKGIIRYLCRQHMVLAQTPDQVRGDDDRGVLRLFPRL